VTLFGPSGDVRAVAAAEALGALLLVTVAGRLIVAARGSRSSILLGVAWSSRWPAG
jgi:hypothetical protein